MNIVVHIAKANTEFHHPFLKKRDAVKRIGAIVVTTDKGLCGGLNTNVLRLVLQRHKEWRPPGLEFDYVAIGSRGLGFLQRLGANVVSSAHQIGDRRISTGWSDRSRRCLTSTSRAGSTRCTSTSPTFRTRCGRSRGSGRSFRFPSSTGRWPRRSGEAWAMDGSWDYIYEPDARTLLDGMMRRYIEAVVFQMVTENMASEQLARMVAMKAATDNAGKIIRELQLIYNKTRQAAITKELSEIVGGAAAVWTRAAGRIRSNTRLTGREKL